jgi:hypothetical protein
MENERQSHVKGPLPTVRRCSGISALRSTLEAMSSRSEALLDEIRAELPRFEIRYKRESGLQKAIHVLLACLTLGAQRVYLTRYHTAMFGRLYVPDAWDQMTDDDRYVLLRHERVHLRQRRRMGDVVMTFVYLIPFFPLFFAYGRARIEWEAYTETIRATAEVFGLERARALKPEIVRRYVTGDYGWMWPFPRVVGAWFDEVMADLEAEVGDARPLEKW